MNAFMLFIGLAFMVFGGIAAYASNKAINSGATTKMKSIDAFGTILSGALGIGVFMAGIICIAVWFYPIR
jgi:hypothetical protein